MVHAPFSSQRPAALLNQVLGEPVWLGCVRKPRCLMKRSTKNSHKLFVMAWRTMKENMLGLPGSVGSRRPPKPGMWIENAFLRLSEELKRSSDLIESIKWGGKITLRPTWLISWYGLPLYCTIFELAVLLIHSNLSGARDPAHLVKSFGGDFEGVYLSPIYGLLVGPLAGLFVCYGDVSQPPSQPKLRQESVDHKGQK